MGGTLKPEKNLMFDEKYLNKILEANKPQPTYQQTPKNCKATLGLKNVVFYFIK